MESDAAVQVTLSVVILIFTVTYRLRLSGANPVENQCKKSDGLRAITETRIRRAKNGYDNHKNLLKDCE